MGAPREPGQAERRQCRLQTFRSCGREQGQATAARIGDGMPAQPQHLPGNGGGDIDEFGTTVEQ